MSNSPSGALIVAVETDAVATHIDTAATTVVRTGRGVFERLAVNTPVDAETVAIYDGVDDTGTLIASLTLGATPGFAIAYGVAFTVGLTVVTSDTADLTVVSTGI